MGASPATGPTPNRGYEAAALQRLGVILQQMTEIVSLAGATSDVGREVLKAMNTLTKLVPSGSVTPAAQRQGIERLAMQNTEQNQQMAALKQQMQGGQGGAAKPPGQAMAA